MQFVTITPPQEPIREAPCGLHLLIEPEPWGRVFLRNLADLFRKGPPPIWTTARPAPYWEDALVHRPVAWARIRQSFLGHALVLLMVLWINLWWLEHPEVVTEEVPQTTITHYQLSEYLPAVTPADKDKARPAPPVRQHAQKADPEYAPQEIVSLHVEHSSKQQTILQPSPNFLHQDVPLPNLIVNSALPGAPVVSARAMQRLPLDTPQVVPPPAQMVSRSQITFPVAPQPQVVAPASDMASARRLAQLPAANPEVVPPSTSVASSHRAPVFPLSGPVVVAPSQSVASRAVQLSIPVQAPEVAPPPTRVASRSTLAQALPASAPQVVAPPQQAATRKLAQPFPDIAPQVVAPPQSASKRALPQVIPESAPQVVPPAPSVASRVLSALGIGAISPQTVPPPQPISAGSSPSRPQEKDHAIGQLLALNARPAPPAPTLKVPEGNRRGEFAAGPTGTPGASARPETVAGETPSDPAHNSGTTTAGVFVGAPPAKITADAVVAGPPTPPVPRATIPDVPSADRIDNQIFGARRRYSIRLSMPNLNSAGGSWIMRFARLNSGPGSPDSPSSPRSSASPGLPGSQNNAGAEAAADAEAEAISTPEPVRKVDPVYPASMIRDRIEGTVILYAIIRADGSVADVRILEGFDARLDENARTALEQWRFRPGTKNGVPIDVEAVVRVPFKVAKPAF